MANEHTEADNREHFPSKGNETGEEDADTSIREPWQGHSFNKNKSEDTQKKDSQVCNNLDSQGDCDKQLNGIDANTESCHFGEKNSMQTTRDEEDVERLFPFPNGNVTRADVQLNDTGVTVGSLGSYSFQRSNEENDIKQIIRDEDGKMDDPVLNTCHDQSSSDAQENEENSTTRNSSEIAEYCRSVQDDSNNDLIDNSNVTERCVLFKDHGDYNQKLKDEDAVSGEERVGCDQTLNASSEKTSNGTYLPCKRHSLQVCTNYCNTCQIPCCSGCISEFHNTHSVASINEALESVTGNLTRRLEKLREQTLPNMRKVQQQIRDLMSRGEDDLKDNKKKVRDKVKKLKQQLDDIQRNELAYLDKEHDFQMEMLSSHDIMFDDAEKKISDLIGRFQRELASGNTVDQLACLSENPDEDLDDIECLPTEMDLPPAIEYKTTDYVIPKAHISMGKSNLEISETETHTQASNVENSYTHYTKLMESRPYHLAPGEPWMYSRYANFLEEVKTMLYELSLFPEELDSIAGDLVNKMAECGDISTWQQILELLFEQGISEPNFRYTGARVCNILCVLLSTDHGNFHDLLLKRCKDEYMDEAIEVKRLCGFAMFMGELFQHIEVPSYGTKRLQISSLGTTLRDLLLELLHHNTDMTIKCCMQLLKMTGPTFARARRSRWDWDPFQIVIASIPGRHSIEHLRPETRDLINEVHTLKETGWTGDESTSCSSSEDDNLYDSGSSISSDECSLP